MKRFLSLIVVASLLIACSGVHNLQIKTEPEGADVYANNSYIGRTPCDVPSRWNLLWSDTTTLKIKKKGYKTQTFNVTTENLRINKKQKKYTAGSKFDIKLEKE